MISSSCCAVELTLPDAMRGAVTTHALLFRFAGRLHVTLIAKVSLDLVHNAPMRFGERIPLRGSDYIDDDGNLLDASDKRPMCRSADVTLVRTDRAARGKLGKLIRFAVVRPTESGGQLDGGDPVIDRAILPSTTGAALGPVRSHHAVAELISRSDQRSTNAHLDFTSDFDFTVLQTAPEEQRVAFLRGDEWVVMMYASDARTPWYGSRLPNLRAEALVQTRDGVRHPVLMSADSLQVDDTRGRATVAFRGTFAVDSTEDLSHIVAFVAFATGSHSVAFPDAKGAFDRLDKEEFRRLRVAETWPTPPSLDNPRGGGTMLLSDMAPPPRRNTMVEVLANDHPLVGTMVLESERVVSSRAPFSLVVESTADVPAGAPLGALIGAPWEDPEEAAKIGLVQFKARPVQILQEHTFDPSMGGRLGDGLRDEQTADLPPVASLVASTQPAPPPRVTPASIPPPPVIAPPARVTPPELATTLQQAGGPPSRVTPPETLAAAGVTATGSTPPPDRGTPAPGLAAPPRKFGNPTPAPDAAPSSSHSAVHPAPSSRHEHGPKTAGADAWAKHDLEKNPPSRSVPPPKPKIAIPTAGAGVPRLYDRFRKGGS